MLKWFAKHVAREVRSADVEELRALDLNTAGALLFQSVSASGISVTGEGALKSPTCLSAIRAISETVGGVPLHAYRRDADGGRDRDRNNPAEKVLSRKANPWTGAAELRVKLVHDALLHGRGVAVVVRAGGKVTELHRVDPGSVQVDISTGEPVYSVAQKDGTRRTYSWREVVDVLTPGSSVDRPLCLTREGTEAIALDIVMTGYLARLMNKGARPGAILTSEAEQPLAPAAFERVLAMLKTQATGDRQAETMVVPAKFKFTPQTFSSVDMEFSSNHAAAKAEIARVFRVPPTILQDFSRAVWRNLEESAQSWLSFGLLPWFEAVEFAFSRALISQQDEDAVFLEHQLGELIRPNTSALYNAGRTATGTAVMTANEWRRSALNLPPIEGGDELVRQAGQTGAGSQTAPEQENSDDEE